MSAQSAAKVTHYSLQSHVDTPLQMYLPSLTRGLADAVDAALRRACKVALGKELLDPEGGFPGQQGPTFTRRPRNLHRANPLAPGHPHRVVGRASTAAA